MASAVPMPTVVIVPGLRDHVPDHWQTRLAPRLPDIGFDVRVVPPMGRDDLDCAARVDALERAAQSASGPVVLVAHSGGCLTVVHWAQRTLCSVLGALLAAPPDFERPMPEGYPTREALDAAGWLPVPRAHLPFRTVVTASRNDPLAEFERVSDLARAWGAYLVDLGEVGHLNPASGFGPWPQAEVFIRQLAVRVTAAA